MYWAARGARSNLFAGVPNRHHSSGVANVLERIARENGDPERLRFTLAVAGFTRDQLDVSLEENQLVIRGRQQDDKSRQYLHRGIAARQFQRSFVLAEGMEVLSADLKNGLLSIDLVRPQPERVVRSIAIKESDATE